MRIKKQFIIILIILAFVENVFAETLEEKRDKYIYNNLSSEYTECQHYYLIVSEALKTNDPDPEVVKKYLDSSKLAGEIAFMYGQDAGMTVEAMLARTKILVDQMLKPLNNNYANISILIEKYHNQCNSMLDNPEIRNQYWINRAYEKIK